MTKYAIVSFESTVEVNCFTCAHCTRYLYSSSSTTTNKCSKGLMSTCPMNDYSDWECSSFGKLVGITDDRAIPRLTSL